MSDLERLKQMDPAEVQKRTYIAPKVLADLLEGRFDRLGLRAKAVGLVNILERELELDLRELRRQIDEYYGTQEQAEIEKLERLEEERKHSWIGWSLAVLLLIAMAGGYYYYFLKQKSSQEEPDPAKHPDPTYFAFETPSQPTPPLIQDQVLAEESSSSEEAESSSARQEEPSSQSSSSSSKVSSSKAAMEEQEVVPFQEEASSSLAFAPSSLRILPKSKLWVGVIYLDTYERKQYLTAQPIELNGSRDLLIVTGHGLLTIEAGSQRHELNKRGKQRFLYKDGSLEPIDAKTFRDYNRGRNW
ncbi:MAG: hypothetical protein C6I00_06155 [Nitratiruptor sp.]|nr:hypothetical protein [Nitratiruptor sp.]NPA83026.1 hypothetical protein [Campylobacterota bacterium]